MIPRGIVVSKDIDSWVKNRLKRDDLIITVGDVVTHTLLKNGLKPRVMIIDRVTRREQKALITPPKECRVIKIVNPRGMLSLTAIRIVCNVLEMTGSSTDCYVVEVDGEEDMLALPVISCAPIGAYVIYGVPDVGIAVIKVDATAKYISSQRIMYLELTDCM